MKYAKRVAEIHAPFRKRDRIDARFVKLTVVVCMEVAPGDCESLAAATRDRIDAWNELGCRLCTAFLGVAERRAIAA